MYLFIKFHMTLDINKVKNIFIKNQILPLWNIFWMAVEILCWLLLRRFSPWLFFWNRWVIWSFSLRSWNVWIQHPYELPMNLFLVEHRVHSMNFRLKNITIEKYISPKAPKRSLSFEMYRVLFLIRRSFFDGTNYRNIEAGHFSNGARGYDFYCNKWPRVLFLRRVIFYVTPADLLS